MAAETEPCAEGWFVCLLRLDFYSAVGVSIMFIVRLV